MCLALHGVGLIVSVGCLSAATRLRAQAPLFILLLVFTFGIFTLLAVSVMMPMIVELNELSNRMLHIFASQQYRFNGYLLKYSKRVIRCKATCKIYSGFLGYHMYYNKRSTKIAYYVTILTKIIEATMFKGNF